MDPKIVIVGSCIIDFMSYASRFPEPGETIHGHQFTQGCGGKGANQCIAAAKLGGETGIVARLGDDIYGKQYIDTLKEHNVNIDHVKLMKNTQTGIGQIVVSSSGENQIVMVAAANGQSCPEDINEAKNLIESSSVLVLQFEPSLDATIQALKIQSNSKGISLVNGAPAVEQVPSSIFNLSDIFCVNETEASVITKLKINDKEDAFFAVKKLIEYGCKIVIITLGKNGAIFGNKETNIIDHISIEEVKPVDTTGAGDMFIGALAYYLAYHPTLTLKEQITRSCKLATKSVMFKGTQSSFQTRDQLPDHYFI